MYDFVVLAAVPIALIGVFMLPYERRLEFALAYANPSLLSLYTANFTHLITNHLLSNLVGYTLVVPTTYLLCALADRRRMFWGVFSVFLTVFPVTLSLLNVELSNTTTRIGLGFSGVLASFFGFLPVALVWYTRRRFTGDVAIQHAPVLYFTGIGILSTIALPVGDESRIILGLSLAGIGLAGHRLLADLSELSIAGLKHALSPAGYLEFGVLALVLFLGFPFAAFPSISMSHGSFTNLFLHLVGYSLGYLVPYLAYGIFNPETSAATTHTT